MTVRTRRYDASNDAMAVAVPGLVERRSDREATFASPPLRTLYAVCDEKCILALQNPRCSGGNRDLKKNDDRQRCTAPQPPPVRPSPPRSSSKFKTDWSSSTQRANPPGMVGQDRVGPKVSGKIWASRNNGGLGRINGSSLAQAVVSTSRDLREPEVPGRANDEALTAATDRGS